MKIIKFINQKSNKKKLNKIFNKNEFSKVFIFISINY